MSKNVGYPGVLYVILEDGSSPPKYQGRLDKDHLPIGGERIRIAEYKLVRKLEVKREVVDYAEVG
jgi:hypothetical protein